MLRINELDQYYKDNIRSTLIKQERVRTRVTHNLKMSIEYGCHIERELFLWKTMTTSRHPLNDTAPQITRVICSPDENVFIISYLLNKQRKSNTSSIIFVKYIDYPTRRIQNHC